MEVHEVMIGLSAATTKVVIVGAQNGLRQVRLIDEVVRQFHPFRVPG